MHILTYLLITTIIFDKVSWVPKNKDGTDCFIYFIMLDVYRHDLNDKFHLQTKQGGN